MEELQYKPLVSEDATNSNDILYIPNDVAEQKSIATLFITDMPFKAQKAIKTGIPIIGYKGIGDQYSDNIKTLDPDLVKLISKKKVHTVVLMLGGDVLDPKFKPGQDKDLTLAFNNIYFAVKKFKESLFEVDNTISFWFAHIKHQFFISDSIVYLDELADKYKDSMKSLRQFRKKENAYYDKINLTESSLTRLYNHLRLKNVIEFYSYHSDRLKNYEFTYRSVRYWHDGDKLEKLQHTDSKLYMRVGADYYKRLMTTNSHKEYEEILTRWKVGEINRDYGADFIKQIPRYDGFVNKPSNNGEYQRTFTINHLNVTSDLYNIYHPIDHDPVVGEWPVIEMFLKHIFSAANLDGELMYEFGLDYIQLSYQNPTQRLPILALVSSERNTGKSTFLDFLKLIFGANMSILDNQRFNPKFTSHFAGKLFVAVDEGHIPVNDKMTKEMIKNMATGKVMWLEGKGTDAKSVDNYTHLIFCTNDERNFMQIDPGENRFAVLKVPSFIKAGKPNDPDLLDKMQSEVPQFLNFLNNRKLHYNKKISRFWFPDEVYVTDALKTVMHNTRSKLEKELEEFFKDRFLNIGIKELNYTLKELTHEFNRESEFSFGKTEIKELLNVTYNLYPEGSKHYTFYSTDENGEIIEKSRKGRFYRFQAKNFLNEEDFDEFLKKSVPFVPFVAKACN